MIYGRKRINYTSLVPTPVKIYSLNFLSAHLETIGNFRNRLEGTGTSHASVRGPPRTIGRPLVSMMSCLYGEILASMHGIIYSIMLIW